MGTVSGHDDVFALSDSWHRLAGQLWCEELPVSLVIFMTQFGDMSLYSILVWVEDNLS